MESDFLGAIRVAKLSVVGLQGELKQLAPSSVDPSPSSTGFESASRSSLFRRDIYDSLAEIDLRLADGYAQAYADLADPSRISWAGTAHEIRELLATVLRLLAPDNAVKQKAWYRQESKDDRPTQKQRAKYILEERRASSSEHGVTEQIELIEERVANLARSTYSRASDAAHRGKHRTEAKRILNYFEAFAHDILDLP